MWRICCSSAWAARFERCGHSAVFEGRQGCTSWGPTARTMAHGRAWISCFASGSERSRRREIVGYEFMQDYRVHFS